MRESEDFARLGWFLSTEGMVMRLSWSEEHGWSFVFFEGSDMAPESVYLRPQIDADLLQGDDGRRKELEKVLGLKPVCEAEIGANAPIPVGQIAATKPGLGLPSVKVRADLPLDRWDLLLRHTHIVS